MTKVDWDKPDGHVLGMFLNGEEIAAADSHGQRIVDDSFVLLFNAHHEDVEFTLPPARFGAAWTCVLRTDAPGCDETPHQAGETLDVTSRSIVLLCRTG
jgi:glycogen operon protein